MAPRSGFLTASCHAQKRPAGSLAVNDASFFRTSRVCGLYRLFQGLDSSWARVSWRCSHAWRSGTRSSQDVFPQYSHCLFCFVFFPHLLIFVILSWPELLSITLQF